jgi:hypothetical protein
MPRFKWFRSLKPETPFRGQAQTSQLRRPIVSPDVTNPHASATSRRGQKRGQYTVFSVT